MERLIIVLSCFSFFTVMLFFKEVIHGAITGGYLVKYLKNNYYHTWIELTTIGKTGPGLANPFRFIPWVFKDNIENDEKLLKLKDSLRIRYRWSFITFTCSIISIIVVACFGYIFGKLI